MPGELERFRVDKIDIRGRDGEDDTVRLRNVLGDEVASLLLDICGLVPNGYLQPLASFRPMVRPHKPLSVQASQPASG